uniref:Uncharacterized protein n=1 Tax=Opuntia streptacantha TaxID=393608 RepID=A0A7C9CCB3_OPUST
MLKNHVGRILQYPVHRFPLNSPTMLMKPIRKMKILEQTKLSRTRLVITVHQAQLNQLHLYPTHSNRSLFKPGGQIHIQSFKMRLWSRHGRITLMLQSIYI